MCLPQKIHKPERRYRLAEIYERYFSDYVRSDERQLTLKDKHFDAIDKAISCRTKKLGICEIVCTGCGEVKQILRSCKHRFCGNCGSWATNQWAKKTLNRLMDIPHHHIIMTLPKAFRKLSQMNGDVIHNALLRCSAKVIQQWFKEKHQVNIGIVAVLHTAGSDLKYHPHVHMIVSRGGKVFDTENYKKIKGNYLCPQRELGQKLKERFVNELFHLATTTKLKIYSAIQNPCDFKQWMNKITGKHWIVSIQKPLDNVLQIVNYVGRYSKRACLSELKLLRIENDIAFKFNDYKNTPRGQKPKVAICKMKPNEFLDKLLQHVPNKGFKMVRYYGLYNALHLNSIPKEWKAKTIKETGEENSLKEQHITLLIENIEDTAPYAAWRKTMILSTGNDPFQCPYCQQLRVLLQMVYQHKTIHLFIEDSS